jgi:TonB-linked SusC/RagA family outer membrane protein
MYKLLQRFFLFAISNLLLFSAQAQQKQVKGTVTDEKGAGLPGVTVQVKGTSVSVLTDVNGSFSIDAPAAASKLVFSFVGMGTKEMSIIKGNDVNVMLSPVGQNLGEVVVIGYGTQNKKNITSSISTIKADEIKNVPLPSVDQLIQGRAAGVTVTQNSGQPGSVTSVRIRGITSLTGNNEPLYIIDGVAVSGSGSGSSGRDGSLGFSWGGGANGQTALSPLAAINPNDILSIDILKDASAQAIYGNRAANGVVLITTKRGRAGESKVTYDGFYGFQSPYKTLEVMNLREYAKFQADLIKTYNPNAPVPLQYQNPSLLGEGTDWQGALFRTAPMMSHQIGVSGGKEKTTFFLSGGYLKQDGMVQGSDFNRYSLRINADNQAKSWLKIGTSISGARTNENITLNDDVNGVVSQALLQAPDIPVRDLDGGFAGPTGPPAEVLAVDNPVAKALIFKNNVIRNKIFGNVYGEISFLKHFTFRSDLNLDFNFNERNGFKPKYQWGPNPNSGNPNALATKGYNFSRWLGATQTISFKRQLGKEGKHDVTAMVAHESQVAHWEGLGAGRENFLNNNIQVISAGDNATASNTAYKGSSALESYFGRVIYMFNNRYIITASLRRDGSSKFDPDGSKVWGNFPAVSAAWNVTNEKFMEKITWLSNLKIRGGYGVVGNQDIANNAFGVALVSTAGGLGPAVNADKISNKNLKWEEARQTNIGFEAGFAKNRINVTFDYFNKNSYDFLLRLPVPDYFGVGGVGGLGAPIVNAGNMFNKGFDITLNTVNINGKNLKWSSTLIFSSYKNRGEGYKPIIESIEFGRVPVTISQEGQAISLFYGLRVKGLFKDQAALNQLRTKGYTVYGNEVWDPASGTGRGNKIGLGDIEYEDISGPDGKPDGKINDFDVTTIGNPNPKFTYGFTNTVSFKGFDLNIFIQGVYGNDILNAQARHLGGLYSLYTNQLKSYANYYSATNTASNIPAPKQGNDNTNVRISDRFVEDGSYIRLQNLSLGYNLPAGIIGKVKLNRARLYANVQNLLTITKYKGFDPEIGANNQRATLMGVDMGRYPTPRTVTFGVNLEF